jgi:hypothetical protein
MLEVHAWRHSVTNKWVGEQFSQGQNIVDRESSEASEASIINEVPEGETNHGDGGQWGQQH